MDDFIVTPYEVKGRVDYQKLIVQFGTEEITDELLERIRNITGDLHFLLERKIFYTHRDLTLLLDEYEKGKEFVLYTGRGPSEEMHVGHLIPFIFTKWLQETFDAKALIQLTDDEKFLAKEQLSLEDTRNFAYENAKDIAAVGFDPKKTEIFLNTEFIHNEYPIALRVAKKITFSTIKAVFGFDNSTNIGLIFFTSLQSVPAFLESVRRGEPVNVLVPMGIDQDPHFRITRDVAPKLGFPKPACVHSKFFPSLDGEEKMSASKPHTAIYLNDSPEDVRKKIWRAFTGGRGSLEEQKKLGGNPEVCSVFKYYEYLFEPDTKKLMERKDMCTKGEIICGDCKKELAERIIKFLEEHRKQREKVDLEKYMVRD